MKYCSRCLQPDTRPNTVFRDNGICPACHYVDQLQHVDWQERFEILKDLLPRFPRSNGQFHDCIIGVSGGKDSTRQALWVRDKLGLNPLLVCLSYPPEQVTERGVNNLSNLIELGFDVHTLAPAPDTWRRLMAASFRRFTNWCRSTELALFSAVPRLAIHYKIPLILWGENPGLQLGDLKTLGSTGYDGNNLRFMNTLSGGGLEWMIEEGFVNRDLIAYRYPDAEEFEAARLQIVYLGWFLGDWSLVTNGLYSCANGLRIRDDSPENTGDLFGVSALDEDWVTLNQMIKYYKFGFGRATDYVNEEIRLGRMSRKDGIGIVEQYDGRCGPHYIESFCDYIDISVESFWQQVHANLNQELFDLNADGIITPKFRVGIGL
ncbi:N-acetyl sugar amidotransferase [bacterium]|nr:N-acetyl sugar amidotransferase [bacterium]